jgi:hypothetical protein
VFAALRTIFCIIFFSATLPNGIRLIELPQEGTAVEITAGYTSGGLAELAATSSARSLTLTAYSAGGSIEVLQERDRTGMRMRVPDWASSAVADRVAALFTEVPAAQTNIAPNGQDFRAKVEEEIRNALIEAVPAEDGYATDRAFVLFSGTIPSGLVDKLNAIPRRTPSSGRASTGIRLPAQRTIRFKSDSPVGAVIFASPIAAVYYKGWYSALLLDRLMKRLVTIPAATALPFTLTPYYYRVEVPVPAGQFADSVEANLLHELERLQFARAEARDLEAARQDALTYLQSKSAQEWFASHGISEHQEEGIQWIRSMSADDMRGAARDLLLVNRVIASWDPAIRQTSVEVETLSDNNAPSKTSPAAQESRLAVQVGGILPLPSFPPHTHSAQSTMAPERLPSGVSIAISNVHAVFVSGGAIVKFDHEPDSEALRSFQNYNSSRLLVLAPADGITHARELWSSFKGSSPNRESGVPKGKVASGDLPALVILKVLLDRKIIEAGWWHDVQLKISASQGSGLQIQASSDRQPAIFEWIKQFAEQPLSDTDMAWAHEVALHQFDAMRADLQALIWERDPEGTIQDLQAISAGHVQDVARIYF